MGNARARPAGFNDLTTLLGSEMNTIDVAMSRAPNEVTGSNGVVAAPATALLWGGAGVTVSGQFTASGATTLSGAITLGAAALVTMSPARTFTRPVNAVKWLVGSSTMDMVDLPIPTSGQSACALTVVPHGATVTSIVVRVNPAVNDGVLPASPAYVSLGRRSTGSAVTDGVGGYTYDSDPSDAEHTITHATTQVLDLDTYEYFVCVGGEAGLNAQVIDWYSARVTFTMGPVALG